MKHTSEALELLAKHGSAAYFGEPVTQLEHALQAAHFASVSGCPDSLIAAALLHDIGHLLHHEGEDASDRGIDTAHEDAGYLWLKERFDASVADPVRGHVPAKRYLCFAEPGYFKQLSPASLQSLQLQGGAFTEEEARDFLAEPFGEDAIRLRRFDDAAKVPGMIVPDLEHYRHLLTKLELPYGTLSN